MNTLSRVPHKIMSPAMLLIIAATILHSSSLCASASLGFEESENGSLGCGKCRCDFDCRRECCPDFVGDLDQPAAVEGNELECKYPVLQPTQQNTHNLFCPPQRSGYYFITDCPPGYGMEMRKACRRLDKDYLISGEFDFSNVTPVTDIRSQLNYWNAFCASCHEIVKENLLAWDVSLNRINSLISNFSLIENSIHMINTKEFCITFQPPKPYTAEKCTPLISSCNQAGYRFEYAEGIQRLCNSPLNSTYKNVFCMLYNNTPQIVPVIYNNTPQIVPVMHTYPELLNFLSNQPEHQESTESPNDSVFDPYLMKFRQLYCSRTKILTNGKCVNNNTLNKIDVVFFKIEITFRLLEKCPLSLASEIAKKIGIWFDKLLPYLEDSKYDICNRDTVYKISDYNAVVKNEYIAWDSQELNSTITFISSKWKLKLTRFVMLDPIYEMILNIANATVSFQLGNNIKITLTPHLTRGFVIANRSDGSSHVTFPANLSDDSSSITFLANNSSDCESMYDACLISKSCITLFLSDLIPCTMVELDEQLFKWSYTEYGIYVPKLNLSLNMTDFNVVNTSQGTSLRICTHVYMSSLVVTGEKRQRHVSFEADTIISIICTFMSLICILLTLIVYIVFPELRTIPGQINMLLVISLMMAQVMYIVYEFTPTSTGSICKGVGVLLHFFWLSAIFWMLLCTFHMFKKFVKLRKPLPKTTSSKTVVIYTVIVIVLSLIFVLTNIIVSLVESDMVEIGYGSRKCYISSKNMVGFTFALPVGFVVLSNLVMFCVVVYKLRSLHHFEMNITNRRNNAVILAKLSSLTGITWIFGFLYIWTEEIILSYLFIVLNASIGIFIMASFSLNKRVIDLIRSKFSNQNTLTNGSD